MVEGVEGSGKEERERPLLGLSPSTHTEFISEDECFCGQSRKVSRAMRDVADQTRSDSTKEARLCVRGSGGGPFIPLNWPCSRFYNRGDETGVEQVTVWPSPPRDASSPLPLPRRPSRWSQVVRELGGAKTVGGRRGERKVVRN